MPPKRPEKKLSNSSYPAGAAPSASAGEENVQAMDSKKYDREHLHLLFSGYELCPMSDLDIRAGARPPEEKRKLYLKYSDETRSVSYCVLDPASKPQKGEISLQELSLPQADSPVLSESSGFQGLMHFKDNILDAISKRKHIISSLPFNHASFCSIQGKEITLLIGNTGAGKSTLINYLMGCEMHTVFGIFGDLKLEMKGVGHARIGHTNTSQTLFAEFFTPNEQDFYADCAGFGENRGVEEAICASVSVRAAINMAKNVKAILLVVDYSSFKTDKAAGIRSLIDSLYKFLPDMDKVGPDLDLKSSIALIVTKLPPQVKKSDLCLGLQKIVSEMLGERQQAYDRLRIRVEERLGIPKGLSPESEDMKNLQEHASFLRMLEFIGFLVGLSKVESGISPKEPEMPRSLIVGNVFDQGSTHSEIQAFVRASSVIPKPCFNVRDDARRNQFNRFLTELIGENISILERHNRLCREIPEFENQINADIFERDKNNHLLTSFDKKGSVSDKERELHYKELLKVNEKNIQENAGAIKNLKEKNEELKNEKEQLNLPIDIFYQGENFFEERSRFLGIFGYSSKLVNYKDMAYKSFKIEKSLNGMFYVEDVGGRKSEGGHVDVISDVLVEEKWQEKGILRFNYKSGWGENGMLKWSVSISKKYHPDNIKRTEAIDKELQDNSKRLSVLEKEVQRLEKHKEINQGGLDSVEAVKRAKSECDRLDKKLADTNRSLASHQRELSDVKKELVDKNAVISLIARLYEVMGPLLLERSYADSFMSAHAKYLSFSASVVKSAAEEKCEEKERDDPPPSYSASPSALVSVGLYSQPAAAAARVDEIHEKLSLEK
jgi:energy-coupling factor transporter ATP-binding protein EcfA2